MFGFSRVVLSIVAFGLLAAPAATANAEVLSTRPSGILAATVSTVSTGLGPSSAGHAAAYGQNAPAPGASPLTTLSTHLAPRRPTQNIFVYSGPHRGRYVDIARQMARRQNIPEGLFLRLVQQESNFDARAVSHKGAIGLAQLMPGTARDLGVNPHDPVENLEGGARYLRMQYDRFKDWRLALAAYNAGPGAVLRYDGVPPFRETRDYVVKIWGS